MNPSDEKIDNLQFITPSDALDTTVTLQLPKKAIETYSRLATECDATLEQYLQQILIDSLNEKFREFKKLQKAIHDYKPPEKLKKRR